MTFQASDIVNYAISLSDMPNTDFITYQDKIHMLNSAYQKMYQKLINIHDKSFIKYAKISDGKELPYDFYQLESVMDDYDNYITKGIGRYNYDIINNHYKGPNGKIGYYPVPATITIPNKIIDCSDTVSDETVIDAVNHYVLTDAKRVYDLQDLSLKYTTSRTNPVLAFEGNVVDLGTGKTRLANGRLMDNNLGVLAYSDGRNISYKKDGNIYLNGEITDKYKAPVFYSNGLIMTIDNDYIISVDGEQLYDYNMIGGYNYFPMKIDLTTSYGVLIGDKLYSAVPDTVFNFPSNVYYNLISYELAVIFCIKQGKDAQSLIALLQDEWNLFYDSETRDGYQQYRVRNVYNNRGMIYGY